MYVQDELKLRSVLGIGLSVFERWMSSPDQSRPGRAQAGPRGGAPAIYTNYSSDVLRVEILVAGPRTRNTAGPDVHHPVPRPGQYSTTHKRPGTCRINSLSFLQIMSRYSIILQQSMSSESTVNSNQSDETLCLACVYSSFILLLHFLSI